MGERPGQAQVMKLVNNLLFATNFVAACEGLVMGTKAGLDPDAMLAMVNAGTGRSMATERVLEEVLSGRFSFGAALSVLDKDVRLGLAEATALDVPMWTLEQAARVWRFAAIQGAGAEDLTVVARFMEDWVRAKIRRPDAG
jgi:3-hydroxyisobutyrate dehydrogenase